MGNPPRPQEKESPSLQTSPGTTTSSNSSSTSSSNSNGGGGGLAAAAAAAAPPPPLTPKTIPRSDNNPYPTTFVQADTSSFKQVVQMLTGSTETAAKHHHHQQQQTAAASRPAAATAEPPSFKSPIPPAKTGPKKPAFKLYERRHNSFKNLKISPLMPGLLAGVNPISPVGGFSPRKQPEILSPSILDFPSLVLSPVTPLIPDPFNRPPHPSSAAGISAEDRAIAEKGFYLHPSPRTTPRDAEPPRLLPLFPVTSPRVSSGPPPSATSS